VKIAIAIAILIATGCVHTPPVERPSWIGKYGNACLPEAIAMAQGLREKQIFAKVLRISTDEWNHAVCVYLYPPGQNKLWVWDSHWMSLRVRAWTDDPVSIAKAWLRITHPFTDHKSAEFYD